MSHPYPLYLPRKLQSLETKVSLACVNSEAWPGVPSPQPISFPSEKKTNQDELTRGLKRKKNPMKTEENDDDDGGSG